MKFAKPEKWAMRFWQLVDKRGESECWPWLGNRNVDGYGRFKCDNRQYSAHRVACQLKYGNIDGKLACHTCDNPGCVNPDHLYPGTPQDNRNDCVSRGRQARGERNGHYTKPWKTIRGQAHHWHLRPETRSRGHKNGRAVITERQAVSIILRKRSGESARTLAAEYQITRTQVYSIVSGKTWKHLNHYRQETAQ